MTVFGALLHLFNFLLPAFFVGGLLAVCAPLVLGVKVIRTRSQVLRQGLINALAGGSVLIAGLWLYGADGKMLTYLVLALVCSLSQWGQLRARGK